MLVNIFLWTGIGILGGLITYFIYPTKREVLPGVIAAGIVGAFTGGVLYSVVRIGSLAAAIDPIASLAAVLSAVMILKIVRKTAPLEEEFLTDKTVDLD